MGEFVCVADGGKCGVGGYCSRCRFVGCAPAEELRWPFVDLEQQAKHGRIKRDANALLDQCDRIHAANVRAGKGKW